MKTSRLLCVLLLGGLVGAATVRAARTEIDVATAPPVVVETVPRAGTGDVAASLTEIRVTFSKDMMTEQMWSVVKVSDTTFPKLSGQVHYVDPRTFVIPVELEPGATYAMWLNYKQNDAFRDVNGTPSIPYLLVFRTRP